MKNPFGFDAAEDSPGFLLWQATMKWQQLIRQTLAQHNTSHSEFVILASLLWTELHHDRLTQQDISNMTKMDKMTVSVTIRKLVSKELVQRQEDQRDTRAKVVTLTKLGRELTASLAPLVEGVDANFFGMLSPGETKSFILLLRQLTTAS